MPHTHVREHLRGVKVYGRSRTVPRQRHVAFAVEGSKLLTGHRDVDTADHLKDLHEFLEMHLGVVGDPYAEISFNGVYQQRGTAVGVRVAYLVEPYGGLSVFNAGKICLGVAHYRGECDPFIGAVDRHNDDRVGVAVFRLVIGAD